MRGEVGIEACLGEVKSMRIIGSQRLKSSRLTSEPKLRYRIWSGASLAMWYSGSIGRPIHSECVQN